MAVAFVSQGAAFAREDQRLHQWCTSLGWQQRWKATLSADGNREGTLGQGRNKVPAWHQASRQEAPIREYRLDT